MADYDFRIPKYIDDPQRFLFWELEELGIFVSFMMIGVLFNFFLIGTILGVVVLFLFSRFKAGKPRGYVRHWLYHKNIIDIPGLPPAYIREFHE